MTTTIRAARTDDADTIARFNLGIARETESLELDRERLAAGVRSVLADPAKASYFLAEVDGRVVGQMMITYEWSDWRNGVFWWIQSVYVDGEHRQQGVFRDLYQHVARLAEADPEVCGLRLYVEEENLRAQQTYARLGMERTPYQVFEVDFVIQR